MVDSRSHPTFTYRERPGTAPHRISATIRSFTRQHRARAQTDKRETSIGAVAGVASGVSAGFLAVFGVVSVFGGGVTSEVMGGAMAVFGAAIGVVEVVLWRGERTARRRQSARARRRVRP